MDSLPQEIIFIIYNHFDDNTLQNIKLVNKKMYDNTIDFQNWLLRKKLRRITVKKIFIDNLIKYNMYPYNIDLEYLTRYDIIILKFKLHLYLFEKVIYSKYNDVLVNEYNYY